MNAKKITLSTIAATLLGLASLSSHAATIFSQDFEAGLGANETSAGGFVLNTTGNAINGSTMMATPPPTAIPATRITRSATWP